MKRENADCWNFGPEKEQIFRDLFFTDPKVLKTYGELFWNIWDFLEEGSTRNGVRGGQEIGGCPSPRGHT